MARVKQGGEPPVKNRYGTLAAWVYHLDKPVGHSFGDIEFYRERLAECRGPILEPAVGNGRMLIPLLEAGHDVSGFDASPEMLAHCRDECAKRSLHPVLTRQRFEDFHFDEKFAAIIIPAGSFQLITEPEAALATLRRFRRALVPRGRLIVDLDPVAGFMRDEVRIRRWSVGEDLLILQETRIDTDFLSQTTVSQLRYEHRRGGRLARHETELFCLRWWGLLEFKLALRAAGFDEIIVSGDYCHGAVPERSAQCLTFEALAASPGRA